MAFDTYKMATAITGDNANRQTYKGLYVANGGNVRCVTTYDEGDGTGVTFTNVQNGTLLPITIDKLYSTGTTATGIIGLN